MNAYCLIDTDGLTINHRFTLDYYSAKEAMDKEFNDMCPEELKGKDDDTSYVDDWDAALHVAIKFTSGSLLKYWANKILNIKP